MKYYLIAGEASGDLHAAHLMRALAEADPQAEFRYYGGDKMQAAGGTLVCHYARLAYMGFVQVVAHLPQILGGMRRCRADVAAYRPDVLILVDYPGFNLGMAAWVKRHLPQVKVVYYISPKIWAWKEWRIRDIKRNVDCMLSILPFEVAFYRKHDYPITYVGNPTVDELAPLAAQPFDRTDFCRRHGLDPERPLVALLAGSRKAEVKGNLPIMMAALKRHPEVQAVVAGAPGLTPEFYAPVVGEEPVRVVFNATYDLLRAATAALVTSGTATLETAYLDVPQVVCYQFRGGMLVYKIMERALRKIRYVSLVNLLLDAAGVTELLGPYLTPDSVDRELQPLLTDTPRRRRMLQDYARMRDLLGEPGAPKRAAARILQLFESKSSPHKNN
jgi:lipid-A-disaccharide synthase